MTQEQLDKAVPLWAELREKQVLVKSLRKLQETIATPGGVDVRFYRKDAGETKCESLPPGLSRALIQSIIDHETKAGNKLNKEFLSI